LRRKSVALIFGSKTGWAKFRVAFFTSAPGHTVQGKRTAAEAVLPDDIHIFRPKSRIWVNFGGP
jgi:hypothetical protein